MPRFRRLNTCLLLALIALHAPVSTQAAGEPLLLDRAFGADRIARFDGSVRSPRADAGSWRQMQYALRAAAPDLTGWPDLLVIQQRIRDARHAGVIPIGLLDVTWEKLRPEVARTLLDPAQRSAGDVTQGRVFAAAALVPRTWRGASVQFRLDPDLVFVDGRAGLSSIRVDFADGQGLIPVSIGETHSIVYRTVGIKTLRLLATADDGITREATFAFEVLGMAIPTPDDTLRATGNIDYAGGVASGDGYVYLAPGHSSIVNPIVVAEGFDLDNSLDWDGIYDLLNRESLVETLRSEGYDLVVFNFDDATDYVQRNAYALMDLLQQVRGLAGDTDQMVVVGASMGGLCARLALSTMEDMAIDHGCRLYISFDAPHTGADIPLGVQHWVDFFAGQSVDAQLLLDALNSPASRQMLLYHHTASTSGGVPDPMRGDLINDLAAVGDYPSQPRKVAVANGSGQQVGQGFAAAQQIVEWDYDIGVVRIIGNVWAVPDGGPDTVFQGRAFVLFVENSTELITVSGTLPWDNAPGGYRNSMAQMDSVVAPFGDIVALQPNHCFIPTISALALTVTDPFYDVAGEANLASLTPFDAVYFPAGNQEHVAIVAENAAWILDEIGPLTVSVETPDVAGRVSGLRSAPNPFARGTRLDFELSRAANVDLRIYAVDGRMVTPLQSGRMAPGRHSRIWDGRDAAGRVAPPGLYFARLVENGRVHTLRMVRMQ